MNAQKAAALYRRLRFLFPRVWRTQREKEFLDTVSDSATAEDQPGLVAVAFDLCKLALTLRLRQMRAFLKTNRLQQVLIQASSPLAIVLGLSALLAYLTVRWGGNISIEFLITSTLLVLVPGIGVIYTISSAIAGGRGKGIIAATGCTLGILPHLAVAFLGLSGIMQLGATVFEVVRWAGVAYLIWMGIGMLRHGGGFQFSNSEEPDNSLHARNTRTIIFRGILLNMLNPKLTMFFFAFLPQFLNTQNIGSGQAVIDFQLIGLSSLFMLLTLIGFVMYALLGAALRQWASQSPSALNIVQRTFGVVLIGFATRLAVAEQ